MMKLKEFVVANKFIIIGGSVGVLAIVGITLGIVLSGDDSGNDNFPTTDLPTDSTTTDRITTDQQSNESTDTTSIETTNESTTDSPPDNTPRLIKIPSEFKIGFATAAYQIEGGWDADGKGPSIWDTFTHDHPESILDHMTGDVADNSYEKYQEDVDALVGVGADFYIFSIAWSRVLPTGDIQSRNEAGIQYYHKLIDALVAKGIEPIATMYHWDLPQHIQDLGGWMNPQIVDQFEVYADLLFTEYGNKIQTWITLNNPLEYCDEGYGWGRWAPGISLPGVGEYYCAHHSLLAHARAYHLYKDKYYTQQQGRIGIALYIEYAFPEDEDDPEQIAAADRDMQWQLGIFAHPIFTQTGDYPEVIRERVDRNSAEEGFAWSRLPQFTNEEVDYVKGSADFLGINYFTSNIVIPANGDIWDAPSKWRDLDNIWWKNSNWPKAQSSWIYSIPEGLYRTLVWIRDNYDNVETIITENGWSDEGETKDNGRIKYLQLHLEAIVHAIEDGCNVTAHASWSLMDNFERVAGYTEKFGIFSVNVDDPELTRVEKKSTGWIRDVIIKKEYTILPDVPPRVVKIPPDFRIGTATAAYQIEGGWDADGKGPSIWDTLTHTHPERIADQSSGDVAANSYEKHREDVNALLNIKAQFYRFSISWSRVLPTGDVQSRNEAGIQYYHNLIDDLTFWGIEPMITMYHWDLPQYLQDLGGWMNPLIVDYFEDYANLLFEEYGDKIKSWITVNEPLDYCGFGYGNGIWAPSIILPGVGEYYCTHYTILAHARVYHLYHDKYFDEQQGKIGITLSIGGFAFPEDENDPEHIAASDRAMQWSLGIFAHPLFTQAGDYPQVIRDRVDQNSIEEGFAWSRLPKFTAEEVDYIKGTSDFLGLNYYTSNIVKPADSNNDWPRPSKWYDTYVYSWQDDSWPKAKSPWLSSVPEGLYRTLLWIRDNYQNVETIITENGWSDEGEIKDLGRIEYLESHFDAMIRAIDEGCNVTGHTTWSLIDNFEWLLGYTEKFGIYRVAVDDPDLKRVEKYSAGWLKDVIRNREFSIISDEV